MPKVSGRNTKASKRGGRRVVYGRVVKRKDYRRDVSRTNSPATADGKHMLESNSRFILP
jgi:hypothetical protein